MLSILKKFRLKHYLILTSILLGIFLIALQPHLGECSKNISKSLPHHWCWIHYSEKMLNDVKVAAIPGDGFGAPDYIRLSFSTSEAQIKEGVRRFGAWIKNEQRTKYASA